jgi:hypothetical protein
MSEATEWKKLRDQLKQQGYRLEKDKHWKVFQGNRLVSVMPGSPGRGRAFLNQKAQLRRAGVKV